MIDPKKLEVAIAEVSKSPIPDEMFLAAYNVLLAGPYFRDEYQGSLSELVEEMLRAALSAEVFGVRAAYDIACCRTDARIRRAEKGIK